MGSTAATKRLESCINDLVTLLALPAIWSGSESFHVVGTLLDVLLTMLRLDFAYARLSDGSAGPQLELVRVSDRRRSPLQPRQFGQALDRWLTGDQTASRSVIPDPAGAGEISMASFSLGLQHELGVLVVGSRRIDFPTEVERLLLRVATNQAAFGLQEVRRSGEQKRIAEILEQRVTERTKRLTAVNDELRRNEAYLAEAQRLSHTGSFGWWPSKGEIIWSEETFRIFQYDRATKPTVELVLQRVNPEDAISVNETIERASRDGKDFEHEFRLVMPDGAIKHVHVVAHAERAESGETEFVGAVMDISDRKRAEEELRQGEALAEQRLRLVVDTTPAMINSCRPDGHLDYVNKGWLDYFGFSLETALDRADVMKISLPSNADSSGGNWQPVIHPEDLLGFMDSWKATLAAGKPGEYEARVRRFDGAYRWHLFRAVPLYDGRGKPVKWYASAFDIEDRKRAEEALRRSEGYLSEAQRLTSTGSWAWNAADRQSVYWSQENYRLFGFDPKVGIPPDQVFYERIHPEDRNRVRQEVFVERPEQGCDFDVEFRINLPDGAIRHVRSTGHPVRDVSGDVVEYVGTSIDITDRKQAEKERERLQQAHAELARVNRTTTLGELTASLAHEVNQPIAAALTNAKTCLRWLTRDHPDLEEAREAASRIAKDATRAADIISRIRLLFKKSASHHDVIDVNEIIRETIVLLRSEAMPGNVSIQSELASDLPHVMGDRVQVQQVLMNLMINGIDAMKEVDGVRELAVKSQTTDKAEVMVSVSDIGVGLPPQQADQIFNAFFTTKPHGTGMGLRISRSIIESHGGRLWAADNFPCGATFCFTLPTKIEGNE
jgi:PAS domain S-box-containing protein